MDALATLSVKEAESYAGNFPKMSQPREVACFSRDGSRRVRYDKSALRKYRPPKLPASLDEGFEAYIPKSASCKADPAPLGDLLGALTSKGVSAKDAQIVTYRNNLNKIFLTPYQRRDDWEVGVEKRGDGVVLLHVRETTRKQQEEAAQDERSRRMAYWGYRFEQLSTLSESHAAALATGAAAAGGATGASSADGGHRVPSPSDPASYEHLFDPAELEVLRSRHEGLARMPASKGGVASGCSGGSAAAAGSTTAAAALGPVNANEEYCSIVQLSLDRCRLLMAAEVDCVADRAGRPGERGSAMCAGYVELKTSKQMASARDVETFERHKLLKFWLQSFLAGVPSIVVGFRDEAGHVRELKTYETKTIHRLVRGKDRSGKDYWNPTACFNFGKGVLEWLLKQLEALEGGGVGQRWVLRYDPSSAAIALHADRRGDVAPKTEDNVEDDGERTAKRQRGD